MAKLDQLKVLVIFSEGQGLRSQPEFKIIMSFFAFRRPNCIYWDCFNGYINTLLSERINISECTHLFHSSSVNIVHSKIGQMCSSEMSCVKHLMFSYTLCFKLYRVNRVTIEGHPDWFYYLSSIMINLK